MQLFMFNSKILWYLPVTEKNETKKSCQEGKHKYVSINIYFKPLFNNLCELCLMGGYVIK